WRGGGGRWPLCRRTWTAGRRVGRSTRKGGPSAGAELPVPASPRPLQRDGGAAHNSAAERPGGSRPGEGGDPGRIGGRSGLRATAGDRGMIRSEDEARAFCAARADSDGLARLEQFATLLAAENQKQNHVSSASLSSVWPRHV